MDSPTEPMKSLLVSKVPARDVLWITPDTLKVCFHYMDGGVLRLADGFVAHLDSNIGPEWLNTGKTRVNTHRIHCLEHRTAHGGPIEHTILYPDATNRGGSCPCMDSDNSVLAGDDAARICVYIDGAPARYYVAVRSATTPSDDLLPFGQMEATRRKTQPDGWFYIVAVKPSGPTVTFDGYTPGFGKEGLDQTEMTMDEIKDLMSAQT